MPCWRFSARVDPPSLRYSILYRSESCTSRVSSNFLQPSMFLIFWLKSFGFIFLLRMTVGSLAWKWKPAIHIIITKNEQIYLNENVVYLLKRSSWLWSSWLWKDNVQFQIERQQNCCHVHVLQKTRTSQFMLLFWTFCLVIHVFLLFRLAKLSHNKIHCTHIKIWQL